MNHEDPCFVIPDDRKYREDVYRRYTNMPKERRVQIASAIKLAGIFPAYDRFGADDCIAILMFYPGMGMNKVVTTREVGYPDPGIVDVKP